MPIKQILTVLDPAIKLDDMVMIDRNDEQFVDFKDPTTEGNNPDEKNSGSQFPFITIRSVAIEADELREMELKFDDTIPTISVTFSDLRKRLTNVDFPLDGDIISIYIRPNDDDVQESIRMDFDIINVSRSGKNPIIYSFYGLLRIPGLYDEVIESKKLMTSFEAALDICNDLDLGFATNEDTTEDRQNWIICREDRLKFLEDIMNYSYKNDNSFFTGFIDHNYFFNFINVQECFSESDVLESALITPSSQSDNQKGFEKTSATGPLLLSNSKSAQGSNMFISYYNPFTESGNIVVSNGYRRYVQYFDSDDSELIEEFIEPMITAGNENKTLLRGRRDESFYKTHIKYKYMGRQSSGEDGNMHPNYLFARILNHQNLEEINKTGMNIEIPSLNTEILRFRRIPLVIYDYNNIENKYSNAERDIKLGDGNTNNKVVWNEQEEVRNEFLSGFYICYSFSIFWNNTDRYKTKVKLIRREWPLRGTTVGVTNTNPS